MLTDTQRKVYSAIISLSIVKQRTPKYREIAEKLGTRSLSTVHKHVKNLVRKGWLTQPSAHELEIVPASLRNGSQWHLCEQGHARVWFQVSECPACRISVSLLKSQHDHVSP